jgi:hypothetical protein
VRARHLNHAERCVAQAAAMAAAKDEEAAAPASKRARGKDSDRAVPTPKVVNDALQVRGSIAIQFPPEALHVGGCACVRARVGRADRWGKGRKVRREEKVQREAGRVGGWEGRNGTDMVDRQTDRHE